jgi:hypothetical protein
LLGGMIATLLLSALLFVAPALGFPAPEQAVGSPFLDIPHVVGGVFTSNPAAASWIGFWLFFVGGAFVFAPLLGPVWRLLPGKDVGFTGAVVKGLLWGLALWVLSGLLLALFAALNRLSPASVAHPRFFAAAQGILGAAGLLIGHLVYGVSVALVAAMPQGITLIETIGWEGYHPGESQQEAIY